jgi:hypothetical protein
LDGGVGTRTEETAAMEDSSGEGSGCISDRSESGLVGRMVSGIVGVTLVLNMVTRLKGKADGSIRGDSGKKQSPSCKVGLFVG